MSEADVNAQIQLALSHGDTRLFRFNAGMAWQGTVVEHNERTHRLVLLNPRAVKLAPAGFLDLAGWTRDDGHAIFTAIECKWGRRRATPEQLAFIDVVRRAGGRAGVARSVSDAERIVRGEII